MAAITEQQLAQGLEDLYDLWSNRTDISTEQARKQFAIGQASLIALFVQGRQTIGTSSNGATVNTIIQ
jgi:hypothetical protein